MTSRIRAISGAAAACLLIPFVAPPSFADAVDDYIRTEMANQRLPGLALAVIRDGRLVKVKTYGFANLELKVPVTGDTVFRLASMSKQIIATGVMLLAADSKLTLEETHSSLIGYPALLCESFRTLAHSELAVTRLRVSAGCAWDCMRS